MEQNLNKFIFSGAIITLCVALSFDLANLEAISARWTLAGYFFFTCNLLIWKPIVIGILNRPISEENANKPQGNALLPLILLKQTILITGAFAVAMWAPGHLLSITIGIITGLFGGVLGLFLPYNRK